MAIHRPGISLNDDTRSTLIQKKITAIWTVCCIAGLLFCAVPPELSAESLFITIGGGDLSGVYFPAGLSMAKLLNAKRDVYGIRAAVEATTGSTFNLNAVLSGYMDFGLAQSDKQYQAWMGLAEWAEKGPQQDLRSVFSLHPEAVTLVAAADAGIREMADLKGKRVSTGNPGGSQHRIVMDALRAVGIDPKSDFVRQDVMASDAPALLQDRRIDAFFFTVGHPSRVIRNALSMERRARIIPISGAPIHRLVAEKKYYLSTAIPVKRLYPDVSSQNQVNTFGVIATLCTASRVPADAVYALTKEVFENFDFFRRQHPAFHGLTKAGMLRGLSAPLHPGAIRYYREAGLIKPDQTEPRGGGAALEGSGHRRQGPHRRRPGDGFRQKFRSLRRHQKKPGAPEYRSLLAGDPGSAQ